MIVLCCHRILSQFPHRTFYYQLCGFKEFQPGCKTMPRYSLRKSDKLLLKSDFTYVKENGQKFVGKLLIAIIAPGKNNTLKCGVVCGKRFSKKAVERNRARRLLWESFRLIKKEIKICHIILIPRQLMKKEKLKPVMTELKILLEKANLIKIKKAED